MRINRILAVIIAAELILGGITAWYVFSRPERQPSSGGLWEEPALIGQSSEDSLAEAEDEVSISESQDEPPAETPDETTAKEHSSASSIELSQIAIQPIATEPRIVSTANNINEAFNELRDYVISTGLDMSFGYMNLQTGYTYKYRGDRVYYGASLVKTLDAMYAYEKLGGNVSQSTMNNIINAATYSKNDAHRALVDEFGIDNLRAYAKSIGMNYHLTSSSIYPDTYYFCDTTVDDQLAEWKHLWTLVNTLPNGGALGEHFRIGWWGVLQFSGHPQFMFKAGFYGPYYNETGIFLSSSPYIFTLLTTNGYRADKDAIMSDLSRRVYEINQRFQ